MTREAWLAGAAARMRPLFEEAGYPLPPRIKASCGWPSRKAMATNASKSRTLGQCWPAIASADSETINIFVSPAISDTAAVLAILAHELCHAALHNEGGHGPRFKAVAERIGLTGPMTSTSATPELTRRLNALADPLGKYPHATLDLEASGEKKQSTRMIKIECPECGWTARTTRNHIDAGLPTCACGSEIEEAPKGKTLIAVLRKGAKKHHG